ncbi:MAG TPA: hypothetical protein VJS17_02705, partial [Pyrinomonadaceae bacterium]|nr:hypothetical protein [Pyrinomonadaceae bacterium]
WPIEKTRDPVNNPSQMKLNHTGPSPGPNWLLHGVVWLFVLVLTGCSTSSQPAVKITTIPLAEKGGGRELDVISGYVTKASDGQKIVIYARSGAWYVQPFVETPLTQVLPDGSWSNSTHLGTEYAALLVQPDYVPPPLTLSLPNTGDGVIAVTIVDGSPPWWRTWWFRLSLALLGVVALFALYRWRRANAGTEVELTIPSQVAFVSTQREKKAL